MEKARILIVEDEAIIAMEVESQLQSLGYEVTSVVNTGQKAVEKAEEDKPDLILMDIRIKGEIDGIDTAEVIRNRFGIPVIFSTAYLDQERIERAKITMPFGYVLKPIQERDLRVTLEVALYVSKVNAERKKAENELNSEKERYRMLYERAPLSYQSLDENGCFINVNSEWLNTLGYTKDEVIGKSFGDFIHPDWADHFKENFPRFKSMGEIIGVEFNMVKKDGSLVLVSFNGKIGYDSEGEFMQTHCMLKDITHERAVEERLRESELKYRKLFEVSIDGYALSIAETGVLIDCNSALQELVGRSREELIGQHQSILHPTSQSDEEFSSTYEKHLNEMPGEILQAQIVTKSGEIKNVNIRASVFELGNKKVMHGIFRLIEN
jgi:PAS domain S-box-containing protein